MEGSPANFNEGDDQQTQHQTEFECFFFRNPALQCLEHAHKFSQIYCKKKITKDLVFVSLN